MNDDIRGIQQMPEHMGCSHGTAKMVKNACDDYFKRKGMAPGGTGYGNFGDLRYGKGKRQMRKEKSPPLA